jgi:hypothetical protein
MHNFLQNEQGDYAVVGRSFRSGKKRATLVVVSEENEDLTARLHQIIVNENIPHWLRACAVYTSACLGMAIQEGDPSILSTVEKVLLLITVFIFSQTPDYVLADVANLLNEVDDLKM